MKKLSLLIFMMLCYRHFAFAQPNLTTFSELTGRPIEGRGVSITAIGNDYLIQGFLNKNGAKEPRLLYKINSAGKIIDSMLMDINGKMVYTSEIIKKGSLNYLLGYVVPSKTVIKSPKRGLIVFDDNLKIIKKFEYDIVPANGFPNYNTSNDMVGDTIISLRNYILVDSLFNLLPGGRPTQIERLGLDGEVYGVTDISDRASSVSDAVVIKNRIFVFGWVASEPPNINPFPVGEYTLDGTFVKVHQSGGFHGGMAKGHKNLIYHVNEGVLYQRNAEFDLLKTVKLENGDIPTGIGPSYKAFAFDNKDNLFYLHSSQNDPGFNVYKINNKLEVLWKKNMVVKSYADFVIATNDGGCLVGFTRPQTNAESIFLLYKLDDLGNITSLETIQQPVPQQSLFYPNSFQSQLTLQQGMEGATQVCLYDMIGRTVGTYTLENNSIKVDDFLPVGTYMAQLKNAQGKVLGAQTVVKE